MKQLVDNIDGKTVVRSVMTSKKDCVTTYTDNTFSVIDNLSLFRRFPYCKTFYVTLYKDDPDKKLFLELGIITKEEFMTKHIFKFKIKE